MGRTPVSMWRLARALRKHDISTQQFGYLAASQSVDEIVARLRLRLAQSSAGQCIAIGHSLGGLLLRIAVATMPPGTPRPRRIIMLATPNHSPRLARTFRTWWWYRALNGDAGQWLANEAFFTGIPRLDVPCTVIAGTRGIGGRWSPFGTEPNDGLVAVAETVLREADESLTVPSRHPFVMNDRRVREIVMERCRRVVSDEDSSS
jgi:hypothetical protein